MRASRLAFDAAVKDGRWRDVVEGEVERERDLDLDREREVDRKDDEEEEGP